MKLLVSMFLKKSSVNFGSSSSQDPNHLEVEAREDYLLLRLFHFVKSENQNLPSLPSGKKKSSWITCRTKKIQKKRMQIYLILIPKFLFKMTSNSETIHVFSYLTFFILLQKKKKKKKKKLKQFKFQYIMNIYTIIISKIKNGSAFFYCAILVVKNKIQFFYLHFLCLFLRKRGVSLLRLFCIC